MAFIDIEDPARRKEIVKEYVQMRNEVRQCGEDNKESNLLRQQTIQKSTRPLIEATERSAKLITSALKPELVPGSITLFDPYDTATKNKDKYYSIYWNVDGSYMLGDTPIQIDDGNNITIEGEKSHRG